MNLLSKLEEIVIKHSKIGKELESTDIARNHRKLKELSKSYKELSSVVEAYKEYKDLKMELESLSISVEGEKDEEMRELINEEIESLKGVLSKKEKDMELMLIPKDPNDEKDVMVEIRAGTGGEEAAIFASDLYRMYNRYAEGSNWKASPISFSEALAGGFKEVIFSIKGAGAYSKLKFESGVHRVQRVPKTEGSGRIHTSTATVAVLADVDDVEVDIENSDLRIETFRSSGAGGQHVNTTDSAVRITHIPTGIVVSCQDGRSQLKNKEKAMQVLKAKIYDMEQQRLKEERSKDRKSQVGSGGRSEKIRTYNFPQGRVTDHRINLTLYNIDKIMDGEIDPFIEKLQENDQLERLKRDI